MNLKEKMKTSIVLVLIVLLSVNTFAQTESESNHLSKVYFNNDFGLIILPIKINNSETLNFIFDTGFDVNVLDQGVAEKLDLDLSDKITEKQPGGSIEYSIVKDLAVEMEGVKLQNENFIVTSISQMGQLIGHQLDGIIGMDFMLKYKIEINYDELFLTIHDKDQLLNTTEYLSLPFQLENKEPFIYCSMKNTKGKTVISKFKMDTGSMDALGLNKNFIEDSQIIDDSTKVVSTKGIGVGGKTNGIIFNVYDFKIGKSVLPKLTIGATLESGGFENRADAGTIGAEILTQFNWVLDMNNNHLYCVENKRRSNFQRTEKSGLWVIEGSDKEKMIYQVIKNSPADVAGLKSGQTIEKINGESADNFSLHQIKELLKNKQGTIVKLKIKEQDHEILLCLQELI